MDALLLSLIFLAPLEAAIFLDVQEPVAVPTGQGHGWIRTFADEQGWWYCHGVAGDYALNHLDDDLVVDVTDNTYLTGRDDLIDHAITRCPDGGYLHTAFSQTDGVDAHHTFRYDASWTLLASNVVVQDDPDAHSSDPPVLCSGLMNATAYARGAYPEFHLLVLDELGAAVETVTLSSAPSPQGSALLADASTDTFLIMGTSNMGENALVLQRYAAKGYALVEQRTLDIPFYSGRRVFWPQGLLRVGDHHLVAYVVTTEASGVYADTGDIWLSAYDADWNLVESTAIVEEPTEWWAYMRPGLARNDDRLLVSFDNQNGIQLAQVILNLEAMGVEPGDSGLPDTGPWWIDTGPDVDDTGPGGQPDPDCGCTARPPVSGLLLGLLGLIGMARRRS